MGEIKVGFSSLSGTMANFLKTTLKEVEEMAI